MSFNICRGTLGSSEVLKNRAVNCWPWVRSLTQSLDAVIHSPADIMAACPTTVTRSLWLSALTRMTQKPFLGVLVGDALDQPRQHLSIRRMGRRFQARRLTLDYSTG
jgi:hypothetical protein